ncbi:MAG: DUF7336 domain-containing protein [bacterium]
MDCPVCKAPNSIYLHSHEEEWIKYDVDKNGYLDNGYGVLNSSYLETITEYGECEECDTIFEYDEALRKITETILEDYPIKHNIKKVYLVTAGEYYDYHVEEIFIDKEKALEFLNKYNMDDNPEDIQARIETKIIGDLKIENNSI